MRLGIVGSRGIPARYGGFETFVQEISPLLVEKGIQVTVYCDNAERDSKSNLYKGVFLQYQHTTKSKHSIIFYLEGIWKALRQNDIILVTGTGGSFFYFLKYIYKKKIITNTDGVESIREKWSPVNKILIKLSEKLAVHQSDYLIADSKGITQYLLAHYMKLSENKVKTIEYGAFINKYYGREFLEKYNLTHNEYYLVVCRLEPENNVDKIIDGYILSKTNKPLVIVGNITESSYISSIIDMRSEKVRFIGGIYDKEELSSIRYSAYAYIHGHSVGGTNPSLLEALGSGNISLCHDNVFNREVTNNLMLYFNDSEQVSELIKKVDNYSLQQADRLKQIAVSRINDYYNWPNMSTKYYQLFSQLHAQIK
jgi:glycosyltransferase involved in cell wall biosynthesis